MGALDPGHDREMQIVPGFPAPAVEDVVLQERVKRLHGRVVAGCAGSTHRSLEPGAAQFVDVAASSKLTRFNRSK